MNRLFTARRISIIPTTNCTLNCKLCMRGNIQRQDYALANVKRDIDACFRLFDRVEWLQFEGGEVFFYQDFFRLLDYAQKYRNRFDRLIIITNATLFPDKETRRAILDYRDSVTLMISHYGTISKAADRMLSFAEENQIDVKLMKYYGEDQYYNGWVDLRNPHDLCEPGDVLEVNARNCGSARVLGMFAIDGRLFRCVQSGFMQDAGIFPPKEDDYVRLHQDSLERQREIVAHFYDHARRACRYCKFKYADILPRCPAGEQIK